MKHIIPIKLWDRLGIILLNLFVLGIVCVYLLPLLFMFVTAFQSDEQLSDRDAPIIPSRQLTALIE